MTGRSDPALFGRVSIAAVQEWEGPLFTRPDLLPDSDRQEWEAERSWLEPHWWSPDSEDAWLCSQSFLVRSGGQTILVDSGVGNNKPRPAMPQWNNLTTAYLDNLAAFGVRPEDVDLVVNTHLHPDHIGWNTVLDDGAWRPTFPNATYLLPGADVDVLSAMAKDGTQPDPLGFTAAFLDSVVPVLRDAKTQVWYGEACAIDDALNLVAAPGHTRGACVLTLSSDGETALLAGDLVHHPMQILDPGQRDALDADAASAARSRMTILGWAADSSAWIFGGHFPGSRGAKIHATPDGFQIDSWTSL